MIKILNENLDALKVKKQKLSKQIYDIETEMVGIKEQIKKYNEDEFTKEHLLSGIMDEDLIS